MNRNWLINLIIVVLNWIPLIQGRTVEERCEYQSVQELIKTSPIVLKALAARIFADIDERNGDYDSTIVATAGGGDGGSNEGKNITRTIASLSSTLITLTPTTIYKGASLLKVVPTLEGGGSSGTGADEFYRYEGQINATVTPLTCFTTTTTRTATSSGSSSQDNGTLNLLPTELIVFGKLDSEQSDVLRVLGNGLHQWNITFENRIWKHLGWDDWSDFTSCSVMCGKGVQQRFRRCLLDSRPNIAGTAAVTRAASSEYLTNDQQVEYYRSSLPSDMSVINTLDHSNTRSRNNKHGYSVWSRKRKKKRGKVLTTTQSCEGYNIEQRNCNLFECGDNITDLLKFYKKALPDENISMLQSAASTISTTPRNPGTISIMGPEAVINKWDNSLNFTIMLTLKIKTKTQSTIFSLRNASRNLYLEQSPDGLKLFQERCNVTEMLPIKLNLSDNRWHQIAISVHNGDFITIYVDCTWTDSFIVSKGLFAIPDSAEVLVAGRNFDGDFQQLLIMPGNHEKLQCSNTRASINEVKRYIIDTFIEDDSN